MPPRPDNLALLLLLALWVSPAGSSLRPTLRIFRQMSWTTFDCETKALVRILQWVTPRTRAGEELGGWADSSIARVRGMPGRRLLRLGAMTWSTRPLCWWPALVGSAGTFTPILSCRTAAAGWAGP